MKRYPNAWIEIGTLEDLPTTTLTGICAAALTQHGEWSLFPQRGMAEAIKDLLSL